MLYLACTTISSVDLAQYGVSLAKDWVSVKCGTSSTICFNSLRSDNEWNGHILFSVQIVL